MPFSLESDAYTVQMQAIALRLLPNEWFIGWGDDIFMFDDRNGGYRIPLSLQLGKVVKVGETTHEAVHGTYLHPAGLRSGPGGPEWWIKLNPPFFSRKPSWTLLCSADLRVRGHVSAEINVSTMDASCSG